MQATELERLARIEEQVLGVRDDIGRMENSLAAATKIMADMHTSFVPRTEINEMRSVRDKEQAEQDKQINALWKRMDAQRADSERMNRKWSWLTGLGAAALVALGAFEAWLRGGGKP